MPSYLPFRLKTLSAAQRTRTARRRERQLSALSNAQLDERLLGDLHHAINTQMNGIIGALEMIRQNDPTPDQCEMIDLAQSSADKLLTDVSQLLESNANLGTPDHAVKSHNPLANIRMLFIDADAGTRARIEKELKLHGARIEVFDLPDIALAELENAAATGDPYRVAILNQKMRGIDGETLGTTIGNVPLYRDTLIVLVSDEHTRHDADRLAQAGFSAWLPKLAPQPMLIDTLSMLCSCIVRKDAPRFVCAGTHLASEHATSGNFRSFAHCRILVVDDNPVNLKVALCMLSRFGCQVDTASGGQQALQLAAEQYYDLILMDCQMPQLDGYQTTALLRATETGDNHTTIIGWSAGSNRNERDTCLAIGMDDFIAKPMRIRPLNDMLARWLQPVITSVEISLPHDDELEETQQMFGEDFAELAHLFLADSPKRLDLLHKAIVEKDAISVAKFSHVLCGSTASIGATSLAVMCRELEIRAQNEVLDEASSRLTAIEIEYARIDSKLHNMLQASTQAESQSDIHRGH